MRFGLGLGFSVGGGGFSPAQIPNMVWRLKADDPAGVTVSGGKVESWLDISGNGIHAPKVSDATRPAPGTMPNGKTSVRFTKATPTRLVAADNSLLNIANGFTLFVVSRPATLTSFMSLISRFGSAGAREFQITYRDTDLMYATYTNDGATQSTSITLANITTALVDNVYIMMLRSNGSGYIELAINKTDPDQRRLLTQNLFDRVAALSVTIGDQTNLSAPFDGDIGEIVQYNRALSVAEADSVGTFLASYWGGTWVPSTQIFNGLWGGQSNQLLWGVDNATYTNEGKIAFEGVVDDYWSTVFNFNSAVDGSALYQPADSGSGHWITTAFARGPAYTGMQSNGTGVNGRLTDLTRYNWVQFINLEADTTAIASATTTRANVKTAYLALIDFLVADFGSSIKIGIAILGRRTGGNDAAYQDGKEIALEVISERPDNVYFLMEQYDQPLQDVIHYTPAGYTALGARAGRRVAALFGKRSTVGTLGGVITSGTFAAGSSTVTATVDLDGGSAISGSSVHQFRIEDDGSPVTINSLSITNGSTTATITFSLASSIASGSVVKLYTNYGQGASVVVADVVKDANGLPLRSHLPITVTQV